MDDERLPGRTAGAGGRAPISANREAITASIERLRRIPGLTYAVVQGKDGQRIDDQTSDGEQLSVHLDFLSAIGRQLGEVLGTGELQSAAVQGAAQHLLLFATRSHFLGVLADGERPLAAVEAEVRKSLAANKT